MPSTVPPPAAAPATTTPATTVLLVEDEAQIRRFVREAMEQQGWRVAEAGAVRPGLAAAGTLAPDLIVLDLGLPDGDGHAFLAELRQWSSTPVIVLSARAHCGDKIRALDAGADDYLAKPFSMAELLARARATLRRQRQAGRHEQAGLVRFGDVAVDLEERHVSKAGRRVHLTPTEYRLLAVLAGQADRTVSNPRLLSAVWGPVHSEDGHYLRVYMGQLRHKLEDQPAQPRHLLTETAVGYRLALAG